MADRVYLNGSLVPAAEARVSAFDHGFLYGYGLFETMRAYGGRIFRLRRHLDRLRGSAETLGIALPSWNFEDACYETIKANGLSEARLRLTLTAGEGEPVPDISTCRGATLVVTARDLKAVPNQPYGAILSSQVRNSQSPLSRMKSIGYAENVLARREAKQAGAGEALLCNEKGLLVEGSISNIFLVKGARVITPCLESGALPGITRAAVLELAGNLGMTAEQREVRLAELETADEAFLTSSILEIVPLASFRDKTIGRGCPGVVTKVLSDAFHAIVRRETDHE